MKKNLQKEKKLKGICIPVLYYHRVNYIDPSNQAVRPEVFERQMKYLFKNGYCSIFLDDLVDYFEGKKNIPKKSVIITFDDGYADNWIYAYPILKKYNKKAAIFVITSRIKDRPSYYRPNLEDVWEGRVETGDLPRISNFFEANLGCEDFLTWEEIKKMQQSGFIDIQSHSHFHTQYYVNDRIIGFNERVKSWSQRLPTDGDVRLGIPLYKVNSSLATRRYFDDRGLRDRLANYVDNRGGEKFFKQKKKKVWMKELFLQVEKYKKENRSADYYERESDKEKRIIEELSLSKRIIEEKLNKNCNFICWPWGKYNGEAIFLAKQCNFRGALTTKRGANVREASPWQIKRFEVYSKGITWFSSRLFIYSHSLLAKMYARTYGVF